MNQEKIGKFIKEIRIKNNLTQKELADKYNVTYQAVSKWENGKNMPDTYLLKQICDDFNISLEEMFDGRFKDDIKEKDNKKNIILFILLGLILLTITVFLILFYTNGDFEFKTISSNCNNFNISGSIAYNSKKSSIHITDIKYCGEPNKEKYEEIECILYETSGDINKKISSYSYNEEENITLDDFLQKVTFIVNDYQKACKEYSKNSLYLSINAKDSKDKITSYKIPLLLDKSCSN